MKWEKSPKTNKIRTFPLMLPLRRPRGLDPGPGPDLERIASLTDKASKGSKTSKVVPDLEDAVVVVAEVAEGLVVVVVATGEYHIASINSISIIIDERVSTMSMTERVNVTCATLHLFKTTS